LAEVENTEIYTKVEMQKDAELGRMLRVNKQDEHIPVRTSYS